MWRRLNNNLGSRQSTALIGDPVLHETTLDTKDYAGLSIDTGSTTKRDTIPPRRPVRGDAKGLPNLPFESLPRSEVRDPQNRPASSIYSEAMPTPVNPSFPQSSYATNATTYAEQDVSPPSSPEFTSRGPPPANANDDDVSPIDDTPDISRLNIRPGSRPGTQGKPASSNIPNLRREKRRNQVASAAMNLTNTRQNADQTKGRQSHDPRWDPYSGEITTSDRGKPQSVKPGEFTPPVLRTAQRSDGSLLGNQSEVSTGRPAHTSFSDRVRRLKPSNEPAQKPGWRGASGRVTLVNPVSDQPNVKPLNIPRKSSKRVASPELLSPVSVARKAETNPLTSNPPSNSDFSVRAVHPSGSRNSPRADSPISVIHDPVEVPASAAVQTQGRRHPNPRPVPEDLYQQKKTAGGQETDFRDALAESYPQSKDPYVEPPSRFSITTYAPSEAHTTPRPSTDDWDRPEMPPLPPAVQQDAPIISRKRPPVLGDSPDRVTRKAIPTSSPVFISMISRRGSTFSQLSKNLPQTPGEASSRDLITSLQAQIDNLQHRRMNITNSIKQMTELMPQDKITITDEVRMKREAEKKKVEGLREEEADLKREEHELGLKLHRAYKRKDKDTVYEPTSLWVRRVTG